MKTAAKRIATGAAVAGLGVVIAGRFAPKAHRACRAGCSQMCGQMCGERSPKTTTAEEVRHA
jgi:hypothetical protein